ncbi:MAG TPA: hypothetical protein VFT43_13805, partial [Candidatus Polarisedimenticolia bacterium]|nr:hypothetical protein [Candidatus Polarisedimenticolia bacterium]
MRGRRVAVFACPIVAILLHLPTLRNDFVFDDQAIVSQNPLLKDLRDLPRLLVAPYWMNLHQGQRLYRPLTTVSFALNRALVGHLDPRWFHLGNVLLHACATLLVTLLALEMLPGARAPAIAGLLFATHPVHVEAVAGIVGRAEILAASGVLAGVLCHRRALYAPAGGGTMWIAGTWG